MRLMPLSRRPPSATCPSPESTVPASLITGRAPGRSTLAIRAGRPCLRAGMPSLGGGRPQHLDRGSRR